MKFKIKIDELGRGDLFIDGKDISNGCYGVNMSAEVGMTPKLELYVRGELEIEGEATTYMKLPNGDTFKLA